MTASELSRRGAGRVSYAEAGAAARQAFRRARRSRCTLRQHVVLEAVVAETASYSCLEARVPVSRIAERAEIDVDAAKDELRTLRDLGIVVYEPGRGRGNWSLVGIPPRDERGVADAPLSGEKGGGEKGGIPGWKRGAGTTPRQYREETKRGDERGGPSGCRPDDADASPPAALACLDDERALRELVSGLADADANTLATYRRRFLGRLDADDFARALDVVRSRREGTRLDDAPLDSEAGFVYAVLSNIEYAKHWTPANDEAVVP